MSRAIAAGVGIILATEAGIPVPVPADLVLLGLGERAGAKVVPLWVVMIWLEVAVIVGTCVLLLVARRIGQRLVDRLTARRPSLGALVDRMRRTLDRRGATGLVAGRATPGLRTLTVLVAALSTIPVGVALVALVVGSSVFAQGHLLLGYAVGPAARTFLETCRCSGSRSSRSRWWGPSPCGSPAGGVRPACEGGSKGRVLRVSPSACVKGAICLGDEASGGAPESSREEGDLGHHLDTDLLPIREPAGAPARSNGPTSWAPRTDAAAAL